MVTRLVLVPEVTLGNVPFGNLLVEFARAVRAGHPVVHLVLGRRRHLGDVDALPFRLGNLAVVFQHDLEILAGISPFVICPDTKPER